MATISFNKISCGFAYRNYDSSVSEDQAIQLVHYAIDHGINYFDTSPFYGAGTSETVLGKALGQRDRSEFFVSTKTGRYYTEDPNEPYVSINGKFDFSAERTRASVLQSLENLQLDYVDIVFCHDIEFSENLDVIINETLPTLNALREEGYLKYIGVSGLPLPVINYVVVNSKIPVDFVLSYTKCTLQNDSLLGYIKEWKEMGLGVQVVAASSLGMGLLTNQGPPDWHPATVEIREGCKKASAYYQSQTKRVGGDLGDMAIAYSSQQEGPCTTLVGFTSTDQIESALNYEIEEDILEKVLEILSPIKNQSWSSGNVSLSSEP
eukprot:TRINITY_DN1441_c0_g1_i1.p1 TRINITY_DN1441_c0_g1~~TRINITY_DN1441_c0_g1_i1.p1  ORF type:complete len:335 (-),score=73.46 TRINITY_DN1441_c0_g1_i1:62-1027(-)